MLVLVPEIALTPQLVGRFRRRLDSEMEVLHSGIPAGERRRRWMRIRDGQAHCVIGARSAIFAPLSNLGLVVIDEEHDGSYKQDENPRYNARDLALWRAHHLNAVCLLGSATPSLESFQRASDGAMQLLSLPERVTGGRLPEVELVSLSPQISPRSTCHDDTDPEILTPRLLTALDETLNRKEQAILFLNRRGFANFIICADCGEIVGCPNCSVSLTHHQFDSSLRCHYCDYQIPIPQSCRRCQSPRLIPFGLGTERLEAEVRQRFPEARVARLDRDSTRRKGSLLSTLSRFGEGKIDILLGTQMLAKGHDYADITLAIILGLDYILALPDYRARERAQSLFVQIAGRAGRAREATVIVQTNQPEFFSEYIGNYETFLKEELASREGLYPPSMHLCRLLFASKEEAKGLREAQRVKEAIERFEKVEIVGAGKAPIEKIAGKFRFNILLRSPGRKDLLRVVKAVNDGTFEVDMDPVDIA